MNEEKKERDYSKMNKFDYYLDKFMIFMWFIFIVSIVSGGFYN
jgi:hypothetical protein